MKHVVKLLLALLLCQSSFAEAHPQSTGEAIYQIQIASLVDPQYKDFQKLSKIGYIFAVELENGLTRIRMGSFSSKTLANRKLQQVRAKGYSSAMLVKVELPEKDEVFIVQLASFDQQDAIPWSRLLSLSPNLCAQLSNDKVKVAVGPFLQRASADLQLRSLKGKARDDIFIKKVNLNSLHKVTAFETGQAEPSKGSGSASLVRNSVKGLQKTLNKEALYTESIDGRIGPATEKAAQAFENQNKRYGNYKLLAQKQPQSEVKPLSLEYYINLIPQKPFSAEEGLQGFEHPMAKVYLAYLYLNGEVHVPGKEKIVNDLMNQAIEQTFSGFRGKTRYDFDMRYAYEDVDQLIRHLRSIQSAVINPPAVPCWLFERHPEVTRDAFAPYWGTERDDYEVSSSCGSFFDIEEMRILNVVAKDFETGKGSQKGANRATLARLYAQPSMRSSEEIKEIEAWNSDLWENLDRWAEVSAMQKSMYQVLRYSYYDALIALENHFMNKNFSLSQARALGLYALKALIGCRVDEYCQK